jgi:hypothetical protein
VWQALWRAGLVHAEAGDGSGAVIERGRLAAAWSEAGRPPLVPASPGDPGAAPAVPSSLADAEEAHLVWRWLTSGHVTLLDASGPLQMPARPVPPLERIAV